MNNVHKLRINSHKYSHSRPKHDRKKDNLPNTLHKVPSLHSDCSSPHKLI